MNIKELCQLCAKYEANQLNLKKEQDLKDLKKQNNSKIAYLKGVNKMIQQKIERVASVDFIDN